MARALDCHVDSQPVGLFAEERWDVDRGRVEDRCDPQRIRALPACGVRLGDVDDRSSGDAGTKCRSAPIGPAPVTSTRSPGATPARSTPYAATAVGSINAPWW